MLTRTSRVALRDYEGDLDGAIHSCRAILGVARSIGDEPTLISALVRWAIDGLAMPAVRRVVASGEPSDEALARLQDDFLDELEEPTVLRGLRGECAMLDALIWRVGHGELPLSALGNDAPPRNRSGFFFGPWATIFFDFQCAVELE